MLSRVLLTLPVYFGSNHSRFLGPAYIASFLNAHGRECCILDEDAIAWLYHDTSDPQKQIRTRIVDAIHEFLPDIIGIYLNTANYKNGLSLLTFLRKNFPEICMVVGGPHITTCFKTFDALHSDLFDYAIVGEGEVAFYKICQLIENKCHAHIPGVFAANHSDSFRAAPLLDIDRLPTPDRTAFFTLFSKEERRTLIQNDTRVFYSSLPGFDSNYARVVATRGCYNACRFCSPGLYWRDPVTQQPRRRIRSPIAVVDEIEDLISKGHTSIYFDDPTFPILSNLPFFQTFCKEIKRRHLSFSWGAPICSNEINKYVLDELADIGMTYTYFGLENYNYDYLSAMEKEQNIDSCLMLIKSCEKRGIHCDASYQLGFPNDSFEAIRQSIDWIFDRRIQFHTFYSLTAIWPETSLAEEYNITPECYEPNFDKNRLREFGLYFYEQGNQVLEQFYSNISGTYHFLPEDDTVALKYYIFDKGLTNRFARKKEGEPDGGK